MVAVPHADGLKDSLLLREDPAVNPSFKPDWSEWATVERTEVQDKAGMGDEKAEEVCPHTRMAPSHMSFHLSRLFGLTTMSVPQSKENFDPRIIGPWMVRFNSILIRFNSTLIRH